MDVRRLLVWGAGSGSCSRIHSRCWVIMTKGALELGFIDLQSKGQPLSILETPHPPHHLGNLQVSQAITERTAKCLHCSSGWPEAGEAVGNGQSSPTRVWNACTSRTNSCGNMLPPPISLHQGSPPSSTSNGHGLSLQESLLPCSSPSLST